GYGPYRSWHHSRTLPSMPYRPASSGGSAATGTGPGEPGRKLPAPASPARPAGGLPLGLGRQPVAVVAEVRGAAAELVHRPQALGSRQPVAVAGGRPEADLDH